MRFFHKGLKKSNETSKSEGCLLIIGFGAIVFFITLLDDISDLEDHFFELLLVLIMGISVAYTIFAKKGKLSNYHVTLKNDFFSIEKISIPKSDLILDVYSLDQKFVRYHLRDKKGKIAIFSVYEDDLYQYFKENLPNQVYEFEETSSKHDGAYISVLARGQNLFYDLSTGKFNINQGSQPEVSVVPEVYTYDPKYKLEAFN